MRAHLAVVHAAQVEQAAVLLVHLLAAREGVVGQRRGAVDLPWQQTAGDRHDRVELAALELALVRGEGEHRGVAVGHVVGKREAVLDGLRSSVGAEDLHALLLAIRVFVAGVGEPAAVGPSHVARASYVTHYHHVLRLGDDRLEMAGVMSFDGLDLRVGRELPASGRESARVKAKGLCVVGARAV